MLIRFLGIGLAAAILAGSQVSPLFADKPPSYTWEETLDPDRVERLLGAYVEAAQSRPDDYDVRISAAQLAFYAWRLEAADNRARLRYATTAVRMSTEAVALKPGRAEGHHWLGAGLGMVGLTRGVLNSLQMVPDIKRAFDRSIEIDPDYLDASALGQLSRLLTMVPGFPVSIGSRSKAMEYVREAAQRGPNQTLYPLYKADLLWAAGDDEAALTELERIPAMKPESEIQFFTYETSKQKAKELAELIRSGARRDPFYDVLSDIQPGIVN